MFTRIQKLKRISLAGFLWLSLTEITSCGWDDDKKDKSNAPAPQEKTENLRPEAKDVATKSALIRDYVAENDEVKSSFVILLAEPKEKDCKVKYTTYTNSPDHSPEPIQALLPKNATYETGILTDREIERIAKVYPEDRREAARLGLGLFRNSVYAFINNAPAELSRDSVILNLDLACGLDRRVEIPFKDIRQEGTMP